MSSTGRPQIACNVDFGSQLHFSVFPSNNTPQNVRREAQTENKTEPNFFTTLRKKIVRPPHRHLQSCTARRKGHSNTGDGKEHVKISQAAEIDVELLHQSVDDCVQKHNDAPRHCPPDLFLAGKHLGGVDICSFPPDGRMSE